jgi:hypothetical protein
MKRYEALKTFEYIVTLKTPFPIPWEYFSLVKFMFCLTRPFEASVTHPPPPPPKMSIMSDIIYLKPVVNSQQWQP